MIQFVRDALIKAARRESKLIDALSSADGMSSPQIRHLLNNLCSNPRTKYLEIGCWQGTTLISALYGNSIEAVGVDNWSEFGNQSETLFSNIRKFIPEARLRFYETDCFLMDKRLFSSKINVYFYDGKHDEASQEAAFTYFNDIFEDVFIAIVDDWNWEGVRKGTLTAFRKLNYKVLFERELYSLGNGDVGSWWNGIYISVIKKPTIQSS